MKNLYGFYYFILYFKRRQNNSCFVYERYGNNGINNHRSGVIQN